MGEEEAAPQSLRNEPETKRNAQQGEFFLLQDNARLQRLMKLSFVCMEKSSSFSSSGRRRSQEISISPFVAGSKA